MRTTWKISTSVTIITVGKYYRTHTPLNSKLEIPPEYIQGLKQDFSGGGGGSVCRNFSNHTYFLKTIPIIGKLRGTVFYIMRVVFLYYSLQKSIAS